MNNGLNFKFKSYVFTIALYGKFKLAQVSGTKYARIFQKIRLQTVYLLLLQGPTKLMEPSWNEVYTRP